MDLFPIFALLTTFLSSSAGDEPASNVYLKDEKEYVYYYEATVSAGSDDLHPFASIYKVTGKLRLQPKTDHLTAKLCDLTFGSYNGEGYYDRKPEYSSMAYNKLQPLLQPFQINFGQNFTIENIVLDAKVPEWTRNIHKAIGSAFSLDYGAAVTKEKSRFMVTEKTINGDCPTAYQVIQGKEKEVQILKQRDHSLCLDAALKSRSLFDRIEDNKFLKSSYNSFSYGVYKFTDFQNELALTLATVGSGLQYSIFGDDGHKQFSWSAIVFYLLEVKDHEFEEILLPEAVVVSETLTYVFENDSAPMSLEEPNMQNHYSAPMKTQTQQKLVEEIFEALLHFPSGKESNSAKNSLTLNSLITKLSFLSYESLKALYERLKVTSCLEQDNTPMKMLLDSLILTGSGPSTLLLGKILKDKENQVGSRAALIPIYLNAFDEAILTEYEKLLSLNLPADQLQVLHLTFTKFIHRICEVSECKENYKEKYAEFFWDKYERAEAVEGKSFAINKLANLGSATSVVRIAKDEEADLLLRVSAVSSLTGQNDPVTLESLLSIFFDTNAQSILRTKAAEVLLINHYEELMVEQMVLSLWLEEGSIVKSFMYSFFKAFDKESIPVEASRREHARSVIKMFPPFGLGSNECVAYFNSSYDSRFDYGQQTYMSMHRFATFPKNIFHFYWNTKWRIAGRQTIPISLLITVGGVEEQNMNNILSILKKNLSFDELEQLGEEFKKTGKMIPFDAIKIDIMLGDTVIQAHYFDNTTAKDLLEKFTALPKFDFSMLQTLVLDRLFVKQPTEFGNAISIATLITALGNITMHGRKELIGKSTGTAITFSGSTKLYGSYELGNNFPAFGTMHSIEAVRSMSSKFFNEFELEKADSTQGITLEKCLKSQRSVEIRSESSVFIKVTSSDPNMSEEEATVYLKNSCQECFPSVMIRKPREADMEVYSVVSKEPYFLLNDNILERFHCLKSNEIQRIQKENHHKSFAEAQKCSPPLSPVVSFLSFLNPQLFSSYTQPCTVHATFSNDFDEIVASQNEIEN